MLSALALCVMSIAPTASPLKLLVFSKTAGFRHDCIPVGQEMLKAICEREGWVAHFTEDADWFQPKLLKSFDVALFLCTTQDVLNDEQQAAFQSWFESGKGYVGIHSAADTEYDWPWYGELVGAWFSGHPRIQKATIRVENRSHATTKHLPAEWVRTDEWYNYKANPRGKAQVLASLDESTYEGGTMGEDHPIIWCRELGKGRTWYTGLGHTKESYTEEAFVRLIAEALRWTGRRSGPL
jgi:type 1 glutamine amidotransferase